MKRRNAFKGLRGGLGRKPVFSGETHRGGQRVTTLGGKFGSSDETTFSHPMPFIREGEASTVASPVARPVSF